MDRRESLKTILAAAGTGLLPSTRASAADTPGLDRYGGWTGKKFKATGFFRVEKDKRWWMVTPEGHAFLSFGINHIHSGIWRQPHNRAAWEKILGIDNARDHAQFNPALRGWVLETCKAYGFNTLGVHNDLHVLNRPRPAVPYMQPFKVLDIPHWRDVIPDKNFVDVFAPAFEAACDKLAARVAAPLKNDAYLVGYSMNDCPLFTEEDCRERPNTIGGKRRRGAIGWPRRLRNLGPSAPGKAVYVDTVKGLYRGQIEGFNRVYGTKFASFDALAAAENWRRHTELSNVHETRDNTAFLLAAVDRYYQCARDALRKHDPNHMFVGDKLHANTDSLDTVIKTTTKYTDVVFYQMYAKYEIQAPGLDRWARLTDMPIINGDAAYAMVTEKIPRPFGASTDSPEERAAWTTEFFEKAFARPEFVGWHYCGLIDADQHIGRKTNRQHSGLISTFGVPHGGLREAIRGCADRLYRIATPST